MKSLLHSLFACLFLLSTTVVAQNETKKWYFGTFAGLNFMTNPPTPLLNSGLSSFEGCASISNAAGNILFYTNGVDIYNQVHVPMANGTGVGGIANTSTTESSLILKKPGSPDLYYVFILSPSGTGTLSYSIVDMSLAAGMGSVTVKGVNIATGLTERLVGATHCNGKDLWIITHEHGSDAFVAFLLTAAGLNTTPVITHYGSVSTPFSVNSSFGGCMKVSPNSKKIGVSIGANNGSFELYDFDNATGVVSNSLVLGSGPAYSLPYGCEFSPDGTKFYGGTQFASSAGIPLGLYQWDLCAGSPVAVAASQWSLAVSGGITGMQLASNGKIYVGMQNMTIVSVIDNPNAAGSACNYVNFAQSLGFRIFRYGFPNILSSFFKAPPAPFTHTVSAAYGCGTASFNSIYSPTVTCGANIITSLLWNFGDPASGSANTSTLTNPYHAFSAPGTYATQLILYYNCNSDTLRQNVTITQVCMTVSSTAISCAAPGSATVTTPGTGPFSYTWMPTGQTGPVATGLSPGIYTITSVNGSNIYTMTATFTSPTSFSGNISNSSSLACNGVAGGTAGISGVSGGSGTQTYLWSNGVTSYTPAAVNGLSAGNWTVTVTDALTSCTFSNNFSISQPPPLTLSCTPAASSVCVNTIVNLSGLASGGTPGYTYSWTTGPAGRTKTVSQSVSGNYVYTLTARDTNACMVSNTVNVVFANSPVLTVSNVSICPSQTGTLTASGAASYVWSSGAAGSTFTDNPLVSQQYTVTGSNSGCIAMATASIILKPAPVPTVGYNAPVCEGQQLLLHSYGGVAYNWRGPQAFISNVQHPALSPALLANSGVYTVIVSGASGCISIENITVTINPSPTLAVTGNTVCVNQVLHLTASSVAGATYVWTGVNGFSSTGQNTFISNPSTSASGNYTVVVTSTAGCTNTAITTVVVLPVPAATITLLKQGMCVNDSIVMEGSGGIGYTWTGPGGLNFSGKQLRIKAFFSGYAGIFTLTVTDVHNCPGSATQSVVVHDLPQGYLKARSLQGCSPLCSDFSFQPAPLSAAITSISWQAAGNHYSGSSFSTCFNDPGNYIITGSLVNVNSCANTVTTMINVNARPVADFSFLPVSPVENTEPVMFTNTSSGKDQSKWRWLLKDETGTDELASSEHTSYFFREAGTYPVVMVVTNKLGCKDTVVKLIKVMPDFSIYIPNAFTPNDDGRNELFMPVTHGVTLISFEVYDRWGEKLFSTTEPANGWDGSYKGQPCKQDMYIWKLNASDKKQNNRHMKGTVSLLR